MANTAIAIIALICQCFKCGNPMHNAVLRSASVRTKRGIYIGKLYATFKEAPYLQICIFCMQFKRCVS